MARRHGGRQREFAVSLTDLLQGTYVLQCILGKEVATTTIQVKKYGTSPSVTNVVQRAFLVDEKSEVGRGN